MKSFFWTKVNLFGHSVAYNQNSLFRHKPQQNGLY